MAISRERREALKEKGNYYSNEYERLKNERVNWDSHWDDVARYVQPRKDDIYNGKIAGERKVTRLYDSTSLQANQLLASALHGMMTSPTSVWFALSSGDRELDKRENVRLWLQDSTLRMTQAMNNSNFQTQIHETYMNLGGIGTSVLFMGESKEAGGADFYFRADSIYQYAIEEDIEGRATEVYGMYKRTYKQLVDEFGEDSLDDDFRFSGQSQPNRMFEVIHIVRKNKKYDEKQPDVETNKPIVSIHVLRQTKNVLKESGFNEHPFAVPRWVKVPNEKYGRSPGMLSLPDIKMLNSMNKVIIRGAQKVVDPPLIVPDNGFALPLDTRPGGSIYKRAGVQDEITPLITNARPDIGLDLLDSYRQRINAAFFIDQLQLIQQNNMTATEVMQRTEENLRMMGPIVSRLDSELLRPIVDRVFGIMLRKNRFAPIPEELKGRDLDVRYVSQIAKAQRASEAETLNRVIGSMLPIIESDPSVMQNFDSSKVLKHQAQVFGLPQEMFKSDEEVEAIKKEEAAMVEEQRTAELNNTDAKTMKDMAAANPQ